LYAAFLIAAPALHHDLTCHRASSTHCPSCVASVAGPDIPSAASTAATSLVDIGSTPDQQIAHPRAAHAHRTSGRAPPASFE
jgi:hypothetical protein